MQRMLPRRARCSEMGNSLRRGAEIWQWERSGSVTASDSDSGVRGVSGGDVKYGRIVALHALTSEEELLVGVVLARPLGGPLDGGLYYVGCVGGCGVRVGASGELDVGRRDDVEANVGVVHDVDAVQGAYGRGKGAHHATGDDAVGDGLNRLPQLLA